MGVAITDKRLQFGCCLYTYKHEERRSGILDYFTYKKHFN